VTAGVTAGVTVGVTAGVTAAALDVRDLVVAFGGIRAVAGAGFRAHPGEVLGIIGPNGSGKTTLLDAVSGQVRPASGSIELDGEDLADWLPEDRARLGLVRSFQDCRLYPELTVEDALLVAEDARRPTKVLAATFQLPRARAAEREKRATVDGLLAAFGLERFRHHTIAELSTGTRRVVDLAAIASAKPRILLLDEPTAGIAQREAEAFGPLLRGLHQLTGATILIVEHDVPLTFSLCHRIVVMEAGRVVALGTPDEVRRDPAAIEAYLGASDEALARSGAAVHPGTEPPKQNGSRPGSKKAPRRRS
jgi:ABC-type branched-subunit amino acid transport system ATPase component